MESGQTEIQLKLAVTAENIALLKTHPSFADAFHDATHETLHSVYFDSDDRSLHERGLTLRVRRVGEKNVQTIKTIDQGAKWFERREWEQPIEGDRPDFTGVMDTAIGSVFTDAIRNKVRPIFETRIERETYHFNGNDTAIAMAVSFPLK